MNFTERLNIANRTPTGDSSLLPDPSFPDAEIIHCMLS